MSFNSEPWFLQASSTDPKTASLLGPSVIRVGWDRVEDARHSASTPASRLPGEIPLLCPSGSPGIMLPFPSHLVRIALSRQISPHKPWGHLGLANYWAPWGQGHCSPFLKCLKLSGRNLSSSSQEFGQRNGVGTLLKGCISIFFFFFPSFPLALSLQVWGILI